MRYKCICSYDGSSFHGFQTQKNLRTVQEEIELALLKINKKPIIIHTSGRTDVGVHAIGQVFHFDSQVEMPEENYRNAINSRIPKDIYIKSIEKVPSDFHARFSAISKEYHYIIDLGEFNPLYRNYRLYYPYREFDKESFKEAMKIYIGSHDFKSFTKNKKITNTVRTIYSIDFEEIETMIIVKIVGNGFMHNMVRILVAMALEVGRGKITRERLKTILEEKNKVLTPKIVPPNGLYLFKVNY